MFACFVRAVALLLFAGQAIAVQAHVHAPVSWTPATVTTTAASTPAPQRPDDPFACPVCREVAHAGAWLTPAPVEIVPPATDDLRALAATLTGRPSHRPSHSWQSRAPPIPLHA